ncbi:hypothetical protein V8G54_019274 [Vigna mungo]|uniref:Uncharacterized protein n=1 Tax=Vigna mungo TaxID=3915 RepID=A0AAQ3RUT2_VIGMU
MTARDAYQYFVLRAQEIAVSKNWSPGGNLQYVSIKAPSKNHCAQLVSFRWALVFVQRLLQKVSGAFTVTRVSGILTIWMYLGMRSILLSLEGIQKASEQELAVDTSDVQQTIWPRAAAAAVSFDWQMLAAELDYAKLITPYLPQNAYGVREILPQKMLPCLLNKRGVPAAPVKNFYARRAPVGPGSCYEQ